jgi:hypothetical protein
VGEFSKIYFCVKNIVYGSALTAGSYFGVKAADSLSWKPEVPGEISAGVVEVF